VAPVRPKGLGRELVEYAPVRDFAEAALDGPVPARSAKEFVLPATEPLFGWRRKKSEIEIEEVGTRFEPTVLLGVRPCDAAGIELLDRVMGWDYRDELWFGRREATTLLALACTGEDEACFCTAVGLSPSSTRGADGLLTRIGKKDYELEALTPKAKALVSQHSSRFKDASGSSAQPQDQKGGKMQSAAELHAAAAERVRSHLAVELEQVRAWLAGHFDDPLWTRVALRCHGCGACAAVCPTCHCFDIVDEPDGIDYGSRRRNWDACQTPLFTVHASGHNPRKDQAARLRQRVLHKFAIYPSRFGEVLCTGCGRCVRVCAAGTDLVAILAEIGRATAEEGGVR